MARAFVPPTAARIRTRAILVGTEACAIAAASFVEHASRSAMRTLAALSAFSATGSSSACLGETTCVIRTESWSAGTVVPSDANAALRTVLSASLSAFTRSGTAWTRRSPTNSINKG